MNKAKNIYLDILQEDFELPKENQKIVKVLAKNPSHIFDVMGADGDTYKAILHSRYQQTVWLKVNKLVIVEDLGEGYPEIVKVLTDGYVKFLKKNNAIPEIFDNSDKNIVIKDGDDDLFVNTNKRVIQYSSSSESSDDER